MRDQMSVVALFPLIATALYCDLARDPLPVLLHRQYVDKQQSFIILLFSIDLATFVSSCPFTQPVKSSR
jgi:hypothetical protein